MRIVAKQSSVTLTRSPGFPSSETRRIPKQQRALARVEKILDAAERAAAEYGTDDVGSTDIAQVAGVPIGSVYQYFPDKFSIYFGATARYHGQVVELAASRLADHAPAHWHDVPTAWVNATADTLRARAGMRAIAAGVHPKGLCVGKYRPSHAEIGDAIREMMQDSFPDQAAAIDAHTMGLGIEVALGLLEFAFRSDGNGDTRSISMASQLMVATLKTAIVA